MLCYSQYHFMTNYVTKFNQKFTGVFDDSILVLIDNIETQSNVIDLMATQMFNNKYADISDYL